MRELCYLIVLVGAVFLVAGIAVPALFWPRCPQCQQRNLVDRESCQHCGTRNPLFKTPPKDKVE